MPKCVTTDQLRRIVLEARRKGFSRVLPLRAFSDANGIDPDGVHVVANSSVHGDAQCVRALFLVKIVGVDEPKEVFQDVELDTFNRIPNVDVTSDLAEIQ